MPRIVVKSNLLYYNVQEKENIYCGICYHMGILLSEAHGVVGFIEAYVIKVCKVHSETHGSMRFIGAYVIKACKVHSETHGVVHFIEAYVIKVCEVRSEAHGSMRFIEAYVIKFGKVLSEAHGVVGFIEAYVIKVCKVHSETHGSMCFIEAYVIIWAYCFQKPMGFCIFLAGEQSCPYTGTERGHRNSTPALVGASSARPPAKRISLWVSDSTLPDPIPSATIKSYATIKPSATIKGALAQRELAAKLTEGSPP